MMEGNTYKGEDDYSGLKRDIPSESNVEPHGKRREASVNPKQRPSMPSSSLLAVLPGDHPIRLPSLVQGNLLSSPKAGAQSAMAVKLPPHHEQSLRVDQCYLPLEHLMYIKKVFEAYDFVKSGLSAKMDVEVRRQMLAEDPPHMKRDLLHRRRRGSRVTVPAEELHEVEEGKESNEAGAPAGSGMNTYGFVSEENKGPLLIPDPPVHDETSMKKRRRLLLFGLIKTRPGIDSERREDGEGECLLAVNSESDSESEEDGIEDAPQLIPGGLRVAQRLYRTAHGIATEHIKKNQAIVEEEIERLEGWKVHQKMLRAEAKANCVVNALSNIAGPSAPLPITVIPSSAGIPFTFFAQQIVARYFSCFFPINNGAKEFEPRRKQHVRAAMELFRLMDTNADGLVSWDEFSAHILQAGQRFILKTELRRAAEKVIAASSSTSLGNVASRRRSSSQKDRMEPLSSRSGSISGSALVAVNGSRRESVLGEGKENDEVEVDALPEGGVEYELGFSPEPTNCSIWQTTYPLVHHLYHQKAFSKLVVSYRSRRYITAGQDGLVKLWKPDPRLLDSQRRMAIVHERNLLCTRCAITDISLTPPSVGNAEAVVVSAMDGTITLLRTATGEVVRTLLGFRSTPGNTNSVAVLNDLVARGADREKKEYEADDLYSLRNRQPVVAGSVIRMPYTIPAYHDDMMEIFFGKTNRYFQGLDVIAPTYTHLKRPVVSSSDILYEFGAEKLLKKLVRKGELPENTTTLCWYATALAVSRCMPVASSKCVLKDGAYLVLGFEAGVAQVYELSMNWFSVTQLSATRVEPPSGRKPVTSFLLHNGPISHILISDVSDLMLSTSNDGTIQVRVFSRLTTPHIVLGDTGPKASLLLPSKTNGRQSPRGGRKRSPISSPNRKKDNIYAKKNPQTSPRASPFSEDSMSDVANLKGESGGFSPFSPSSFLDGERSGTTPSESEELCPSSASTVEGGNASNPSVSNQEEGSVSFVKESGAVVGHTKRITCICYHETQHLIVSGGMDHCVIFWTSRSNRFIRHLDLRNLQYHASSPSPSRPENGISADYGACGYPIDLSFMERNRDPLRLVVLDNKRVIRLLNALNGNFLEAIIDNSPSSVALGELMVARYEQTDDRLLLGGRCLRVWDVPRDEEYAQDYFGHKKPVIFMGMDPTLRIFVTADEENIVMWNFTIVPHEIALQRREDRRLQREQERLRVHQEAEKRKALRMARRARQESQAAKEAEQNEREKARASATARKRSIIYGLPLNESSSSSKDESTDDDDVDVNSGETGADHSAVFGATRTPQQSHTTVGRRKKKKKKKNIFRDDTQETGNSEEEELAAIDARAYEDEIPVIHHADANQFNLTYWRTSSRVVRTWKVLEGVRSVALETSTRAGGIYVALLRERSIIQYNSFNGAPLRKFLFPETASDVYRISAGETLLTQAEAHPVTPLLCAAYEEDGSSGIASIYLLNHSGEDPDGAVKRELQERAELLARGVKIPKGNREAGAIRSHRNLLLKAEPCTSVAILSSLGVVVIGGRHRLSYSPIMDSTSYPLPCMTLHDEPTKDQERERRKSLQFFNEHFPFPAAFSDHHSTATGAGGASGSTSLASPAPAVLNTSPSPLLSRKEKPSLHLMALFPGRLVEDPVAVARGVTSMSLHRPQSGRQQGLYPPYFSSILTSSHSAFGPTSLSPLYESEETNVDVGSQSGKGEESNSQSSRMKLGRGHVKATRRVGGEDSGGKNEAEEVLRGGGGITSLFSSTSPSRSAGDAGELERSARLDNSLSVTGSISMANPSASDFAHSMSAGKGKHAVLAGTSAEGTGSGEEGNASEGAFYLDAQQGALGFIGHIVPVRDLGYVFTGRNDGILQLWNIRSSSEVFRCRVTLQVETITSLSISCFGACRTDVPYSPYDAWTGGKKSGEILQEDGDSVQRDEQSAVSGLATPGPHPEHPAPFPFSNYKPTSAMGSRNGRGASSYTASHYAGSGGGHHRRQNALRDAYFVAVGDQSGYVVLMDFNGIPWEEDTPLDVIPGIERRVVVLDRWRAHRLDVRGICFVGNPDVRGGDVVGMEFMSGSTQVFSNEDGASTFPAGETEWLSHENQAEDGSPLDRRREEKIKRACGTSTMNASTTTARSAFPTTTIPITMVTTGEDTYTYVWVWEKGTINCLGCFGGCMGNPVAPPLIQMPRRSMDVFDVARRLYVMQRLVGGFKMFQSHKYGEEIEMAVKEMELDAKKLLEEDDAWQLAYFGSLAFLSDDQFPCYKQTFWSLPLRRRASKASQATQQRRPSASTASHFTASSAHEGEEPGQGEGEGEEEENQIFSTVFDRAGLKGMRDRLYKCPSEKVAPLIPAASCSVAASFISASSAAPPFSSSVSGAQSKGGVGSWIQRGGISGYSHPFACSESMLGRVDAASEPFVPYVLAFMRGTYDDHSVAECLYRVVKDLRPQIKKFFRLHKGRKSRNTGVHAGPIGSSSSSMMATTTSSQVYGDTAFPPSVEMRAGSAAGGERVTEGERLGCSNGSGAGSLPQSRENATDGGSPPLMDPFQRTTKGMQLGFTFSVGSARPDSQGTQQSSPTSEQLFQSGLHGEFLSGATERVPSSVGRSPAPSALLPAVISASSRDPLTISFNGSPDFPDSWHSPYFLSSGTAHSPHLPLRARGYPPGRRRGQSPTTTSQRTTEEGRGERSFRQSIASLVSSTRDREKGMQLLTPGKGISSSASVLDSPSSYSSLLTQQRLSMTKGGRNSLSRTGLPGISGGIGSSRNTLVRTSNFMEENHENEKRGAIDTLELKNEGKEKGMEEVGEEDEEEEEGEEEVVALTEGGGEQTWTLEEVKEGKEQILLRGTRGVPMYKVVYQQPGLAREFYIRINDKMDDHKAEQRGTEDGGEALEDAVARQVSKLPAIIAEEYRRQAIHGNSIKALSNRRLSRRDGYTRNGKEVGSGSGDSRPDSRGVGDGGRGTGTGRGMENLEEAALHGESSVSIVERAYISRRRQKAIEQILRDQLVADLSGAEEKEKKAQEIQLSIDAGLIVIETYKDFSSTKTTTVLFDKEKVLVQPRGEVRTQIPEAFIKHAIPESFHIQQMGEGRDVLQSPTTPHSTTTSSSPSPRDSVSHTPIKKNEEGKVEPGVKKEAKEGEPTVNQAGDEKEENANEARDAAPAREERTGPSIPGRKVTWAPDEKHLSRQSSRRSSKKNRSGDWYVERDRMKQRRKFQNSLWSPARIVHTLMAWKSPIPLHLRQPFSGASASNATWKLSSIGVPLSPSVTSFAPTCGLLLPPPSFLRRKHLSFLFSQRARGGTSIDSSSRTGSKGLAFSAPTWNSSEGCPPSSKDPVEEQIPPEEKREDAKEKEEVNGDEFSIVPLPRTLEIPCVQLLLPPLLPEYLDPFLSREGMEGGGESRLASAGKKSDSSAPVVSPYPASSSVEGGLSSVGGITKGSRSSGDAGETERVATASLAFSTVEKDRNRLLFIPTEQWGGSGETKSQESARSGGVFPLNLTPVMKNIPAFPSRAVWDTALDYNEGKTNLNALVASEVMILKSIAKQSLEERERLLLRVKIKSPNSNQQKDHDVKSSEEWSERGDGEETEDEDGIGKLRMTNSVRSYGTADNTVESVACTTGTQSGIPESKLQDSPFTNGSGLTRTSNAGNPPPKATEGPPKSWAERSRPRVMTLADVQKRMMKPSPALS